MENQENATNEKSYKLGYHGTGSEYFGIIVVNFLLTIITLGIYYPWARARQLQYLYGATSLNEDRFKFSGTGKEMFIGFLKIFGLFTVVLIIFGLLSIKQSTLAIIFLYLFLILLIPLAIHGSYRYKMSRTSWRGIRFGYRGDKWDFFKKFLIWMLLTVVTLGIYSAWAEINIRKYIMERLRAGNAKFDYHGNGGEYFGILLKGFLLTVITAGIYSFWWQKNIFNYLYDNTTVEKDDTSIKFSSIATGGDFFKLQFVNLLILIFTLGIGYAWVVTRIMKFVTEKVKMEGDIDLDTLEQTEEEYRNAMGEDMLDFFDIDFAL